LNGLVILDFKQVIFNKFGDKPAPDIVLIIIALFNTFCAVVMMRLETKLARKS
jgi:hypothetical protein